MPAKRSRTPRQRHAIILSVGIATLSAAALVAFAAYQSPDTNARASRRPRLSRAAINAAEERAIWARPKTAVVAAEPTVTITGCVERHDEGFRLKNASGDAVPKSRSWKSGFFRKGPAPIELLDAHGLAAAHVGERVRVSGTIDDREMRVRALQRIADSCS